MKIIIANTIKEKHSIIFNKEDLNFTILSSDYYF